MARCAGALFFLFLSYYLVKPLRNSQFLKEFPPHALPWIYLVVSGGSLLVTRVFQWCASRMSRKLLVAGTFSWAMMCKVLFFLALPVGGQTITGLFYLWASVYFLLLVSTLWGCLNERFRREQGERCFPFIALGSTIGNIAGSYCADALSGLGYYTLLWSALALALSLLLLWRELDYPVQMATHALAQDLTGHGMGWIHDRFLRAIAFMVLALAVFSTTTDFVTQRRMDLQIGKQVYLVEVASLWPDGYAEVSALRQVGSSQRQARLWVLADQHGLDRQALQSAYERFSNGREKRLREVFAGIFMAQGLLGVVVLGVICRPFLTMFGLSTALIVLPSFALCVLPVLLLPLDVTWIQLILVCFGALNYSFNNATKEILYTATDRHAIIQAKPFIEGPLMRLGDVVCSLLTIAAGAMVAYWTWPSHWEEIFMVVPCFILVLVWWVLVRAAGRAYQALPKSVASLPTIICASDTSR